MKKGIALLDGLDREGSELCLIATYNLHLPFFEAVVLPKLEAAGCRYVAVLADARQCAAGLSADSTRPRRAGHDYALFPIQMPGGGAAFHPKVMLLAGARQGRLLVGSHNLTVSGMTSNREITNLFEVDPRDRGSLGVQSAQAAWRGLRAWCGGLPAEARHYLDEMLRVAPWLEGPTPLAEPEATVLVSQPTGPSLWSSVRSKVAGRVRRVFVLGAFFDEELEFVKVLAKDLRPREIVVGLDARTVAINGAAAQKLPGVRFVDAHAVGGARGYLHAKLIALELEGGRELVVTGSANPSAPAWVTESRRRNAEAIVLRQGPRRALLERLGLGGLAGCRVLSRDDWAELARRRKAEKAGEAQGPEHTVVLALDDGESLWIDAACLPKSSVILARVRTAGGVLEKSGPFAAEDEGLRVPYGTKTGPVQLLTLRHRSGEVSLAVPYRPAALAERSQTGVQRELRQAMVALEGGEPHLADLFKLVERAIFTPSDAAGTREGAGHGRAVPVAKDDQAAGSGSAATDSTSLARDLELEPQRGKRRKLTSLPQDLVLLLDILIRRLGADLVESLAVEPGEEEGDEEDGTEGPDGPPGAPAKPVIRADGLEVARHCRKKIDLLLTRRLLPRIEQVFERTEWEALHAAAQAAAVLKLVEAVALRELRPPAPIPYGATLVDRASMENFLWRGARYLCHPSRGVLGRALQEGAVGELDEVSAARGMLIWFAWAAGIDVRWARQGENREAVCEKEMALADLLLVLLDSIGDSGAIRHAREALARTCDTRALRQAYAWLDRHLAWGEAIWRATRPGRVIRLGSKPRPGDMVVVRGQPRNARLVVDVYPGVVVVADPDDDGGVVKLSEGFVEVVEVTRAAASIA